MTKTLDSTMDVTLHDCPNPQNQETPTSYASRLSSWYTERIGQNSTSQVFTPSIVAKFMARKCIDSSRQMKVLDPGVGIGILSSAIIEAFSEKHKSGSMIIDAIDNDASVIPYSRKNLAYATEWAAERGISVTTSVLNQDFLEMGLFKRDEMQQELTPSEDKKYDAIIMNPPYFKIASSDKRVEKIAEFAGKQSNIYSLFLSVALTNLKSGGKLVSINPRSFASGLYYQEFRKNFFDKIRLREVHLFNSRKDIFPEAGILQETLIIFIDTKKKSRIFQKVKISSSQGIDDLHLFKSIKVPYHLSILHSDDLRLALPTTTEDKKLLERINRWENRLSTLDLEISTGPVVPFRVEDLLLDKPLSDVKSIPLLWMNNISKMSIVWPQQNGKPEYFVDNDISTKYSTPCERFVLLRRFSAKEDRRRLTAAVISDDLLQYQRIAIENHVTFIHSESKGLEIDLANGLAGLLNSSSMDRYFRIINGNTQVNVYDIELMPLPSKNQLKKIGNLYSNPNMDVSRRIEMIDSIIHKVVNI